MYYTGQDMFENIPEAATGSYKVKSHTPCQPAWDNTKPTIDRSELIKQRRLGLSYKQIGRKLGIDPHKEDVTDLYSSWG